ncbi:Two component transcriptional regulator, LytTR family [Croceitalea dokdonensis DOKDO 023]|uniref:Two component transcriptional regulator, LytTR family n=1 Tax=Croceitalea dokdonensis DOKDO 023 TaxID=1300341 RepID=A0A0P7ATZ0_9FLAO|nr:LytTR family DNA-binding domain-containing protein [Croceitalea dokdonensis]KPM31926.1 Two component transcriptional regulator, LytTR family [Croceitalea dokdonensis DOKDO 023]
MTCVIIEDQVPAQRILQKYIEDAETLELKATFSNAMQAMDFLKTERVDILFLDIHLPKLTGIEFLKSLNDRPHIILTTAFSEYALESYELHVVDYLLKPFSFQRFLTAVGKVQKSSGSHALAPMQGTSAFFVKSGHEYRKIKVNDINYIQSDTDYTFIFTGNTKHLSAERLKYWEDTLAKQSFFRIHKSYLINITKISRFLGNRVYLEDGTELPIGRSYKEAFMKQVLKD